MITRVWYRIEGQKDLSMLGFGFRGVRIVGKCGWVDVNDWHLCFDTKKYIYVFWRDNEGRCHRDGWFPDR